MMKLRTRRSLAIAGSALALGLALSGCSALNNIIGGSNDAPRDDDTGEVTEDANIDIFSLKVGDCMPATDASGAVQDTDVVTCDTPHADEVYYEFELPDGDFPGDTAIETAAGENCVPAFTDFVGLSYDESTLDFWYYSPTQESWESANDRLVQCIITDPAGDVTGSLAGAAR